MGRFITFTVIAFFGVSAIPALAVEKGAYRPGTPYQSLPLSNAALCELQCRDDSACRGWNFVKVNPRQASGVCELNSQAVAPIKNTASISGTGARVMSSSRLVSKGTRTVRVGTPDTPKSTSVQNQLQARLQERRALNQNVYQAGNIRNSQNVVLPTNRLPANSAPRHIQHMQGRVIRTARNIPHLSHALDATQHTAFPNVVSPMQVPLQAPISSPISGPISGHAGSPLRLQHSLGSALPTPQRGAPKNTPHNHLEAAMVKTPSLSTPSLSTPSLSKPSYSSITDSKQHPSSQQPNLQQPNSTASLKQEVGIETESATETSPTPRNKEDAHQTRSTSTQVVQSSLFGSLYDDVKQPKPISAKEMADPDAPIATVSSVPVKKVNAETLFGLAADPQN